MKERLSGLFKDRQVSRWLRPVLLVMVMAGMVGWQGKTDAGKETLTLSWGPWAGHDRCSLMLAENERQEWVEVDMVLNDDQGRELRRVEMNVPPGHSGPAVAMCSPDGDIDKINVAAEALGDTEAFVMTLNE